MSHLDEGTLHALLDGELDLHEVREIQAHLGSCTACDSRFQAAKDVYGEADRLVGSVQFPGAMRGMKEPETAGPAPAAVPLPEPPLGAAGGKKRRIEAKPVTNVGAPQVVILPEQNDWPERRRRWMAGAKWAAVLCVAVGAGFLASEARKNSEPGGGSAIRAADSDEPNWVVSQDEMTESESLPMARVGAYRATNALRANESTPEKKVQPKPAAPAERQAAAQPRAKDTVAEDTASALAKTAALESRADQQPAETDEPMPAAQDPENVRAEAAEALAQLDAQRRRERAAAAMAALDRSRREAAARQAAPAAAGQVQAAAAPPPPPPTLEQRSGIYLRIGLDEAARQLGRPVHVIEGMGAQFMGLVQGGQAPGADDNRPAVRVVYQDAQDRMILLDQQRIRPGQAWPSGATQWSVGEIGLALHGDVPAEVLRNLRPRVR
jgi:anti-sigma factor RsiW